jgi:hypothetical protein
MGRDRGKGGKEDTNRKTNILESEVRRFRLWKDISNIGEENTYSLNG